MDLGIRPPPAHRRLACEGGPPRPPDPARSGPTAQEDSPSPSPTVGPLRRWHLWRDTPVFGAPRGARSLPRRCGDVRGPHGRVLRRGRRVDGGAAEIGETGQLLRVREQDMELQGGGPGAVGGAGDDGGGTEAVEEADGGGRGERRCQGMGAAEGHQWGGRGVAEGVPEGCPGGNRTSPPGARSDALGRQAWHQRPWEDRSSDRTDGSPPGAWFFHRTECRHCGYHDEIVPNESARIGHWFSGSPPSPGNRSVRPCSSPPLPVEILNCLCINVSSS